MGIRNNRETVWHIEENKLKKSRKVVSKITYNGIEVPVLKSEMNSIGQEFLFKDKNNEYWYMNIVMIEFKKFIMASEDNNLKKSREYCDKAINFLSTMDLKEFFSKKIKNVEYFNICELEYISKYYPELYEKAKESRNMVKQRNEQRITEIEKQAELEKKEKVRTTNEKFISRLQTIKEQIRMGKCVPSENFEFYKENKYENGITSQNCFLYLAKSYEINIPLATQGFINNRLVNYDFTTGEYCFRKSTNSRPSEKVNEFMNDIYIKVVKEYVKDKARLEGIKNKEKEERE